MFVMFEKLVVFIDWFESVVNTELIVRADWFDERLFVDTVAPEIAWKMSVASSSCLLIYFVEHEEEEEEEEAEEEEEEQETGVLLVIIAASFAKLVTFSIEELVVDEE